LLGGGQAITTGSNNTIIGAYGGFTTLANNIVLSDGQANVRLFSDANGLIGINQAVGSTIGGQLDIHTSQTYALVLNGLTTSNAYTAFSNNNVGKWRIGNTYNAGANSFDIFNLGTSSNALSINSTTNVLSTFGITNSDGTADNRIISRPNTAYAIGVQNSTTSNIYYLGVTSSSATADFQIYNTYNARSIFSMSSGGLININSDFAGYGTFGSFGQLCITGVTDTAKRLAIGYNTSANVGFIQAMQNGTTYTPLLLNSSGGNVLIGTTTDDTSNKLQVNGSVSITGNSFLTGYMRSNTGYETRIDGSSGITPSFYLSNVANSRVWNIQLGASNELTTWYFDGSSWSAKGYQTTSGVWTNSDIRKKKDIEDLNYGLDEILKLKPKKYKYIHDIDNKLNGKKDMGFIAQEVIDIIPEAVGSYIENDTEFLSMSYANLVPILVKAIQELNGKLVRNNIN
jgi:hypothetical protein